ncbi:hypothetical protein [Microbispora sp. H10830]|uniref:hypothetical protein n=1 Tax=Microbispora sp. H10830 TaxID=2729109 RepID=UPI0016005AF9|nr:hypothetical protein [Microbispora sp. H10830]
MSTSERFGLRPSPEEWRRDRTARGELRDQRFELPPGVPSVCFDRARLVNVDFSGTRFTDRVTARVRAVLPLVETWPDEKHRKEARFSLEFLAGNAVEHNDDHAVVSPPD